MPLLVLAGVAATNMMMPGKTVFPLQSFSYVFYGQAQEKICSVQTKQLKTRQSKSEKCSCRLDSKPLQSSLVGDIPHNIFVTIEIAVVKRSGSSEGQES